MFKSKILLFVALFLIGAGATFLIAHRGNGQRPAELPAELDVRQVQGMNEGEVVVWPQVQNVREETVRLDAGPNGSLLVIVFSSDCQACRQDTEFWKQASAEAARRKVATGLMSIDRDIVSAKRLVQDFGLAEIPMFFDKSGEAARNFKINMVPQYLLFRNDGQLMRRWAGLSHFNAKLGKMQHPSDIFRSFDGSP